jgi:hypothetical protein
MLLCPLPPQDWTKFGVLFCFVLFSRPVPNTKVSIASAQQMSEMCPLVAQTSLWLLPQPLECWYYKHEPPLLALCF